MIIWANTYVIGKGWMILVVAALDLYSDPSATHSHSTHPDPSRHVLRFIGGELGRVAKVVG